MTVRRVLDALRSDGACSRAELVRRTGVSAPTISKAVAPLVDAGFLEEGEPPAGAMGRPGRLLRLSSRQVQVVGVVLEPDRLEIVAAGLDGQLIDGAHARAAMPADYSGVLDWIEARFAEVTAADARVLGVGISVPGLNDRPAQQVILSPNLPSTDGRSPARDLAERLGVPCRAVQESHALCLAENMVGAGAGLSDYALIDATTGLGLGVIQGGELLLGSRGLAGELGHLTVEPDGLLCGCGNRGCLETRATDAALARDVSERIGRAVQDTDELLSLLRSEPERFRGEIDRVSTWLSVAIAGAINLFNPSAVFVHARWPEAVDGGFESVVEAAQRRALGPAAESCRLELARASKPQGAVAAALDAWAETVGA